MSVLGNPEGIFLKERDHMAIYRAPSGGLGDMGDTLQSCTDYFYNYFAAGLDILFDGRSHRAKKFVLHTNFPGHADFNVYHKCQFRLEVPTLRELSRTPEVSQPQETVGDLLGYPEFAPAKKVIKKKKSFNEKVIISPDMQWEDVKRELGVYASLVPFFCFFLFNTFFTSYSRNTISPLVLGQASNLNPFGSTLAYGHGNCVFEVMKNGHLASVTLFEDE